MEELYKLKGLSLEARVSPVGYTFDAVHIGPSNDDEGFDAAQDLFGRDHYEEWPPNLKELHHLVKRYMMTNESVMGYNYYYLNGKDSLGMPVEYSLNMNFQGGKNVRRVYTFELNEDEVFRYDTRAPFDDVQNEHYAYRKPSEDEAAGIIETLTELLKYNMNAGTTALRRHK